VLHHLRLPHLPRLWSSSCCQGPSPLPRRSFRPGPRKQGCVAGAQRSHRGQMPYAHRLHVARPLCGLPKRGTRQVGLVRGVFEDLRGGRQQAGRDCDQGVGEGPLARPGRPAIGGVSCELILRGDPKGPQGGSHLVPACLREIVARDTRRGSKSASHGRSGPSEYL
ncbi:unnamed protein product, partial [Effrenium voratum]